MVSESPPLFPRRILIASLAGLLVLFLIVLHPLARSVARAAALNRGWNLQSQSARFGWRGLWLRRVRVTAANAPELQANFGAVLVPWSGMIGSKRVAVYGGEVRLPARLNGLSQRLNKKAPGQLGARIAERWQAQFAGLTLLWQAPAEDVRFAAWGISGDASNQNCRLSVDRIEAGSARLNGVLTQTQAVLSRANTDWTLEKAEVAQSSVVLVSGNRTPFQPASSTGPIAKSPPVSASHAKTIAAKVAIDVPEPDGIERLAAAFAKLQNYTQRLRDTFQKHVATSALLDVGELNLRWQYLEQKLDIGPLHTLVKHDADATEWTLEQNADANAARRFLSVRVPNQPSKIELDADMGQVSLQTLGVKELDLGLHNVADSKLAGAVKVSIDEIGSTALWEATGEIRDLNVTQPWLAPRPIEGIQAAFSAKGELKWQPEFLLKVQNLSSSFGKARIELSAQVQRRSAETIASVDLQVPLAACEDLVDALPRGLAPLASEVHLDGTLSLQSGVRFNTAQPNATEVQWKLANGCRVKSANLAVSTERFRAPFILEVPDEHAVFQQRAFGPGTPNWVAGVDMSPQLANAVLVCEDGGFFNHNGFDSQAIRNSIRENLVQGRFARGASTVSMQLAKNLYLRREKTFSRKLQEAVLTLLLEQSFTKNELMELYLNLVELGPGIYGVAEAARVYFNTTPALLTPLQSYYLMSLLPNPKALHFEKDGHLASGWLKLLRRLMTIANKRHYLTDEELKVALQDDLRLGVADSMVPASDASVPGSEPDAMIDSHDATEQ